jgi:hypothetical protein
MDEAEIVGTDVDELWLREWAQSGLVALGVYLAKQAAFRKFLQNRDVLGSSDGDNDSSCV